MVTYDPGQEFSLSNGDTRRVTITNTFPQVPGDLAFVCGSLGRGGEAIWRITNPEDVPGLRFTTTQGVGPGRRSCPARAEHLQGEQRHDRGDVFSAPDSIRSRRYKRQATGHARGL